MTTAVETESPRTTIRHTFEVRGMHCASCVAKIESALRTVPDVDSARVTLNPPVAVVHTRSHIPSAVLNQAVAKVGDYKLIEGAPEAPAPAADSRQKPESLYPLILIVGYILGTVIVLAAVAGEWSLHRMMNHFMAGFFLVFSFFKLLDLRGFAIAYRSYDVVARAAPAWGFAYPFIEMALGIAYLVAWQPFVTNTATLIIMLVGAVGVLKALLKKRAIQCACLGTVLNLPMTKVTLVEDLGMAAMAAVMLVSLG